MTVPVLGTTGRAQTTTGSIRGYVRGPNETPLSDVQVAAGNTAMGSNRRTISNASGFYSLAGLRPGDYEITVRRIGLRRRRAPGNQTHTITANGIVRIPYQICVSSIVSLGSGLTVNADDNRLGSAFGQQRKYVYSPPTKPFLGIGHVFSTQSVDLRLEKAFAVANAQRVSLVADVFNAFGNANYGCYTSELANPPNPNYNNAGCAGLGRRLQVGLRYGLQPMSQAGTQSR